MPMRVYVAGPLFSPDQRSRLQAVARAVEAAGHEPWLPFDETTLHDGTPRDEVFAACVEGLRGADAVVAVLDGADADSGTAFEVGFARSRGVPVLGLRSDHRTLGPEGEVNLMLERGVNRLARVRDWAELPKLLEDFLDAVPPVPGPRLVRDKVPGIHRQAGRSVTVRRAQGETYGRHLKRFLVRAAEELAASDGDGEKDAVADLLEGVEALLAFRAFDTESVRRVKRRREEELGGLDQGYVLDVGETGDGDAGGDGA